MTETQRWLECVQVRPETTPGVLARLVQAIPSTRPEAFSRNDPPAIAVAERQAAVLILLATDGPHGPDLLLQQRADTLRAHAGEVCYPGGAREAMDEGPVETALREAVEETDLDPSGVDPLATLPRLHIPPSRFDVTGVVAHWRKPSPVRATDQTETARVMRVPLATLADPANRIDLETNFGWRGPAFRADDMVIWGYTGEVLAALLHLGGWERPWTADTPVSFEQA